MGIQGDKMSHHQRMEALFHYQKPDRVPIYAVGDPFCMVNVGYTIADLFNDPQKALDALLWTCEQYGWEPEGNMTSAHHILGSWDFGAKIKIPDSIYSQGLIIEEYAVKTEDEGWNLKMPDPKTAGALLKRMEFSKLQEKVGLPIRFMTRSPFNTAADMCGVEMFCRWLPRKPELCHRLMRMATEHIFQVLEYWITTFGAENIFFLMSSPSESNQLISPDYFKQFALPYHREFHNRLRSMGIHRFLFHICGDQNLNLPHLAELAASPGGWPHPSILSFGHEVDLAVAASYFPEDIIMGNIEPAMIQTAHPQKVYDLCKNTIEKGKKIPGGFILAPGCGMPPRAPSYNVWMMTKAVSDYGWY